MSDHAQHDEPERSADDALPEDTRAELEALNAERQKLDEQRRDAEHQLLQERARRDALQQEIAAHQAQAERFVLLEQLCSQFERLDAAGAGELFWGELAGAAAEARLARAREHVAAYHAATAELEARCAEFADAELAQSELLAELEAELLDKEQQEDSLRSEWLVEREEQPLPVRAIAMPWMRGFEDDRRFHKTLAGATFAALLLGLIIPWIDLPIVEFDETLEVPERFAQLMRQEPEPLPAPVAQADPEPEPPPEEPEPEPELVEEDAVAAEQVVADAQQVEPTKAKVNSKGILAFRKNFENIAAQRPNAKLGADAEVSNAGQTASGVPTRDLVAARGSTSSGGVNLAKVSRNVGGGSGGELQAGIQLTQVESRIGGGGPDDRPLSSSGTAGRTDEEIQIVFDRYKARLYRLYNRELRNDPTLRGQMVLRLTIEPDGSVSLCALQDSDMNAPTLADQIVASVRAFDFGAKDVPAVTILYPIDFLPTA